MAIFFDYVMTVDGATARLDKDIHLFKGNKNIDYYFTIKDAAFRYSSKQNGNVVEKLSPSHAMVSVLKPDGNVVTAGMAAIEDDKVKLTITEDIIDEDTEVGTHCIVIDLLDDEKDSLVTLPPILNQMHIYDRITPIPEVISGNIVNEAMVNYAQTDGEEEELIIFDNEGKYVKTLWKKGNKITVERLNKIEEGIFDVSLKYKDLKDNEIILVEDDTSTEGISDTVHDNLKTNNKTIIGGINEINDQLKDTVKKADLTAYAKKTDIPDISTKVDKVTGKGLSTNDYTTAEKNKLSTLKNYDDTTVKADISNIKNDIGTGTLATTSKTVKGAINEVNAHCKDIANISLAIGEDGLLYIKKQDGTLMGTGVKVSSDTDLSKVTMRVNGNTLILLNNGTQISSVDLPSTMSDTDVSNLITKSISKTAHDNLGTTEKTIIGGINEVNKKVKTLDIHYETIEKETSSYFEPIGDVNIFKQDEYLTGYIIENSTSLEGYAITPNTHGLGKIAVVKIKPNTKYSIVKEDKVISDDSKKMFVYATDSALFYQGDDKKKIDGTYERVYRPTATFTSTATDNYLYIYFSDDINSTDRVQVTEGERTDFITTPTVYNPSDKLNVYSKTEVDDKLKDIENDMELNTFDDCIYNRSALKNINNREFFSMVILGDSIGAGTAATDNYGFIQKLTDASYYHQGFIKYTMEYFYYKETTGWTQENNGINLQTISSSNVSKEFFGIPNFPWVLPTNDYKVAIVYCKKTDGGEFDVKDSDDKLLTTINCNGENNLGCISDYFTVGAGKAFKICPKQDNKAYVISAMIDYQPEKKGYKIVNWSEGGRQLCDYTKEEIKTMVLYDSFDTVYCELFANDSAMGKFDEYFDKLAHLIDTAKASKKDVILNITNRNQNYDATEDTRVNFKKWENKMYEIAKEKNCCLINFDKLIGGYTAGKANGLIADTIHPTNIGHEIMAKLLNFVIFKDSNTPSVNRENTMYAIYGKPHISEERYYNATQYFNDIKIRVWDENGNKNSVAPPMPIIRHWVGTQGYTKFAEEGALGSTGRMLYINQNNINTQANWRLALTSPFLETVTTIPTVNDDNKNTIFRYRQEGKDDQIIVCVKINGTEQFKAIQLSDIAGGGSSVTPTTKYTITNNLSHATNSNSATSIEENASYNATITPNSNYRIKNVTVTMYGTDVTDSVYSGGRIIIPRVVGNIVITVTTELVTSGGDESNLEGLLKDRLLVWHDEFDGKTLDTTKWRYATHNSGGSEQQAYTVGRTENVRLENSNLILEARKDGYVDGWTWSSGRIDTSGLAGFKYGRLEAKLKYDVVSGAFPAFWTIGTCAYYPTGTDVHGVHKSKGTQWAQNGEIDMFEGRGTNSEIAQGGWYNQDDGKGNQTIIFGRKNIDASQYHVYAVEWTETTMISYIDGVETGRTDISNIESWHRPMYIILNTAVGSTGGYPADDCTSIKMEVDWVRVYAPVGVTAKEEVQSISLTQNNLSFNMGDDPIDVYYTVNPSTAWDNNVNYESSNTSVAEVYGSRVIPKGIGNCKITARATNGVTATINVTVAENANINAKSITLNKDTLEIYNGTNSTLIASVTPSNHTDSVLWKSSNTDVATVNNGVVTGKTKGICTITAYSSADASVKAECSVTVKEAVQLKGHPTSGLTLQLDRNGMSSTSWTNAVDNTKLQWKVANNNSPDIASYMVFDGDSFYWAGANYKDHLTLSGFSNYYDFGESQTIIIAGDFTNALNPILSNKQKLSQNANTVYLNNNGVAYSDASGTRLGAINLNTSEQNYNINGCIALRYNKQTLRVDTDTMEFTGSTVNNKNTTLSSAFTQGTYPALLGNVSTAKIYWKVVLVYNRVLTDAEIGTTMNAITTFLNE